MPLIYLIRHAQASFGSQDYDRLSEVGMRQAEILGEYFANLGFTFRCVYSGPMVRQISTAQRAASRADNGEGGLNVVVAAEFNEYDVHKIIQFFAPGIARQDFEFSEACRNFFRVRQALEMVFERVMGRWASGSCDVPGCETWLDFNMRVRVGLDRVRLEAGPNERIAIFTSAGVIASMLRYVLGLSDEQAIRLALHVLNTSVSVFRYDGNLPILLSYNSVAHLELQHRPELLTYR
jgi:broad specificity phosphatase PhoE